MNRMWWVIVISLAAEIGAATEPTLIGHWPLRGSDREQSGSPLATRSKGVEFNARGPHGLDRHAARFDGIESVIEIDDAESLRLGTREFSVSLWANTEAHSGGCGDLVSQYDPATRTGFHLGLYSHGGVTNSQPNSRQLHFGIDQGRLETSFVDHGRLGNAVFVFALCVHAGRLYAATCHAGREEPGHVFQYESQNRWTDLGSPDKANSISAMAVHQGELYAASSKYRLAGSALAESQNPNFGGRVFRLGADDQWISCGTLSPETEAVGSLIDFRGKLYASSLYRPAGFFRYDGDEKWTPCATPDGKRVEAMIVHNGAVYATSYDEGSIFRFDGNRWESVGRIPDATQTYGLTVHRGELYVSEWPLARVFRYTGGTHWVDVGKLGQELEAMPLLVYNGKMYGGTLPSAEVFRFDGDKRWTSIGRVDQTPDVKYRRAWSMAVFQGRLFVGTLPSGKVLSIEAGSNSTWDHEFPAGWHHVAAVRASDHLRLYVDGKLVSQSAPFAAADYDLTNRQSLQIGFGAQDHFRGEIADVRLFRGALSPETVLELSKISP